MTNDQLKFARWSAVVPERVFLKRIGEWLDSTDLLFCFNQCARFLACP